MKRILTTAEQYYNMTDAEKQKKVRSIIRCYNAHIVAEQTLVAFCYKKQWYMFMCDHVKPSWCKLSISSRKSGHRVKANIAFTDPLREMFLRKYDCTPIPNEAMKAVPRSKGHSFEKYVTETMCHEEWKRDNIPFYVQGDVVLNGKQVQVKAEKAQIVADFTLCQRGWAK